MGGIVSRRVVIVVVCLALLLALAAWGLAQRQWRHYDRIGDSLPLPGVRVVSQRQGEMIPLEEILQRLHLPAGARILEVEREHLDGRLFYEIELVTVEGRIYEVWVDPHTGAVIAKEDED